MTNKIDSGIIRTEDRQSFDNLINKNKHKRKVRYVKIRRNYKFEKIEGVDLIELEHNDNFLLVIPATLGCASIRLRIDHFGKLVIKGPRSYIEVQY